MEEKKLIKVFIVDDSDFSRNQIKDMLENTQFSVVGEAFDAKSALESLNDVRPDIMIIDVVMPNRSGIELCEIVHENFSNLYVIMISSLAHEAVIMDSISAGASDFIQKPFKKTKLIDSLEKMEKAIQE